MPMISGWPPVLVHRCTQVSSTTSVNETGTERSKSSIRDAGTRSCSRTPQVDLGDTSAARPRTNDAIRKNHASAVINAVVLGACVLRTRGGISNTSADGVDAVT